MSASKNNHFTRFIKGKIIIIFLLACFALCLAWVVSKVAFRQMMVAVENIVEPNNKLRLVNELSRQAARLDQLQRARLVKNTRKDFFYESKKTALIIDTLENLYSGDSVQLVRLQRLQKLLGQRDKLFLSYLNVRNKLINDKLFTLQVQELNNLLDKNAAQDSSITHTAKTTVTTIYPEEEKDTRSFFSKLFGKKKEPKEAYKVVNEELNIERDTIAEAIRDSLTRVMSNAVMQLEKNRLRQRALFVNRENIWINANDKLISQIQAIVKQVESEVVAQAETNNNDARLIVSGSVKKIGYIMLAFVLLTVILLYFILTDLSKSARYRKALEEARDEAEYHSKAKQRFLSNMSHEIRTPLQSIIGYAELIKDADKPQKHDIEAIYQSSGHLMQIVNEVLDYNRIISGKFSFSNEVFNITALLNEVISVMRPQTEKKQLELISNFNTTDKRFVTGDPFRLKQVLYNLLGNAIKFTTEGRVTLSVASILQGDKWNYTFRVTDTGKGITEEDINRIFNEFEQATGQPAREKRSGTGLGLAICKELVEQQGGNIHVTSKLGKGSDFTVILPFAAAEEPEYTIEEKAIDKTDDVAVWVVDDDSFILNLCALLFEKHNITYRSFQSPTDMLNAEWDDKVKIIFADIRMPGMDGKQLCANLRRKVPADVRIYALTAQALPQENDAILSAGFNGVLIKPFREKELLSLVNVKDSVNSTDVALLPNLSAVKQMTYGDEAQLNAIIEKFAEDTFSDISALKVELKNGVATNYITLLLHRMAGRTAQIGATELAAKLKAAEYAVEATGFKDKNDDILTLLTELQNLVTRLLKATANSTEMA
ncbi:response regulator [Mucilaginibacter limnophilus]|uniref:histidine kinase n=1 Tax=Mucilaginibacter limnophilus TaxID=1932778 RepID=A0A437MYS9_9SPHI|nr:ATP-binding protein [Mucilaginibacter limnophilus]RVU02825.1 response regulator [Mucilaginibacter limnophilus]